MNRRRAATSLTESDPILPPPHQTIRTTGLPLVGNNAICALIGWAPPHARGFDRPPLTPPPPAPTLHRRADGTAWKMEGGGVIKPTFLPPLPLPITHIMLKWMNKWMNEWMNEQTNECKNTKKHYTFSPPAGEGGGNSSPPPPTCIYIAKKNIQFEPKNSSEFFNATGIFPPCFGKKLIREHLTFKFQTI